MAYERPSFNQLRDLANFDILVDILRFIEDNRYKISFLADQKGGWEGWLQAELAWHIERTTSYTVDREEAVFNDQHQHIDLWCTPRPRHVAPNRSWQPNYGNIGVELKCEGMWQDVMMGDQNFHRRVMADVAKVDSGINQKKLGPMGCLVYVLGVTTAKEDIEHFKFQSDTVTGWPRFDYWASSPKEGPDPHPALYVFWWQADFGQRA
ncbi:MAG: hypothetical protein Q9159_007124 [Coniocarpon cinnabarinum]